jgi:hypothetical protein
VDTEEPERKVFSYEEALALMPQVRRLTEDAYQRVAAVDARATAGGGQPASAREEVDGIVRGWAEAMVGLGLEIKGLWLVDFDNGEGYYCWKYPEETVGHYHGYEEGFAGRISIH